MKTNTDKSFLGVGWGFPPTFKCSLGGVEMLNGIDDIMGRDENEDKINELEGSLFIIISTELGERVMQPTFGCGLRKFMFEPLNIQTQTMIENIVYEALVLHEPRIKVEEVSSKVDSDNGVLKINVRYFIVSTNTRYNYVYPFYIKEATNLTL